MSICKITKNDVVFISGPMSGLPDYNRKAFNDADYIVHSLMLLRYATKVVLLPGYENSHGSCIEKTCAIKGGSVNEY